MSAAEELLRRNHAFASDAFPGELAIVPSLRTVVITCADHRVDPAHVLGLELGEAAVVRNPGGRITPGAMQSIAMLAAAIADEGQSGSFELIVLHHTDCGMVRLAKHEDLLGDYFGIDASELQRKSVTEPRAAVVADVAALAENALLPDSLSVSGLVYDTESGLVEVVVEPGPLRTAGK